MGRSVNSLKTSDVTTTPIKLKYSSSFYSSSMEQYGIKVYLGVNEPVSPVVGYSEEAMTYLSIRHMYYADYVSGSFPTTSSYYNNYLQSTAASGTLEADVRYFPTGSGETIQVISIPKSVYGEKVSRYSFKLKGDHYYLVDDGNGNVWDLLDLPGQLTASFFSDPGMYYSSLVEYGTHVGNIIYSHGMVIITNQDYQEIFGNLTQYLLQEDGDYILTEDSNLIIL